MAASLYAQSRYFISNEQFFMIKEIPASSRDKYEYVLMLDAEVGEESGILFKNDEIVGYIRKNYDSEDRLIAEEILDKEEVLIERIRYSYYPDGRPRATYSEYPDGSTNQFMLAERTGGGFDYYQVDAEDERIRIQANQIAAIRFRESRQADEVMELQTVREDSDGMMRNEQRFANGSKRVEYYQNDVLFSEELYEQDVLVQRTRYTYSPEGQLLVVVTERADQNEQVFYSYQSGRLMREEIYIEDAIIRTVDYDTDDEKTITHYRNEQVFLIERYSGEDRTELEITPSLDGGN